VLLTLFFKLVTITLFGFFVHSRGSALLDVQPGAQLCMGASLFGCCTDLGADSQVAEFREDMQISIESKNDLGTIQPSDGDEEPGFEVPPELADHLLGHLQAVRQSVAHLAERSEKCAAFVNDDQNILRYLCRCGSVEKAVEALQTDLPRRFQLKSAWDD
jgi:hypothetical protein